jgi:HAD superfamily hydrolase (TIGR01509 family)
MVDTIIFDLDGLLVDTTEIHFRALNMALIDIKMPHISRFQYEFDFVGVCTKDILKKLEIPEEFHKDAISAKRKYFESYSKDIRLSRSIVSMLSILSNMYTLALASNNNNRSINAILKDDTWFFKAIVSKDDVDNPKPAPDVYLEVMNILGITDTSKVIAFEDSLTGMQSAQDAGIPVIYMSHQSCNLENISKFLRK